MPKSKPTTSETRGFAAFTYSAIASVAGVSSRDVRDYMEKRELSPKSLPDMYRLLKHFLGERAAPEEHRGSDAAKITPVGSCKGCKRLKPRVEAIEELLVDYDRIKRIVLDGERWDPGG